MFWSAGGKLLSPDNTATVLAASVSAGALVAIFAAKSLGIAIAGAAGFITLRMHFPSLHITPLFNSLVLPQDYLPSA